MNFSYLLILASMIFGGYSAAAQQAQLMPKTQTPQAREWVDSVYNSLTDRQRIEQIVFMHLSPESDKHVWDKYYGRQDFGGVLLGHGSVEQYAKSINYIQSVARVPVIVTLDGEWGLSMRMPQAPRFPHNQGLGAIRDTRLLYEYGLEVARECRLMGIHVNFAPDADVNSNPRNPVIGYRSFGEDPRRVAECVTAYSLGLEDGGVQSVAKHFPGHGDTETDSHKALATVDHSRQTLQEVDLVPFVDYIDHGLSGVMVGHIAVPALDPSGTPASLSKLITTDLLRKKLRFKGLIYTDALGMKGADVEGGGNNAVDALLAGADVLLSPRDPDHVVDAIVKAIASGKVSQEVVKERCKKILAYKYALGLADYHPTEIEGLEQRLNSPEADAVNRKLAAASMTCLVNRDNTLPLSDLGHRSIAVVNIGAEKDNTFTQYCRRYASVAVFSTEGELSASTLEQLKRYDTVIAAVYNDKSSSISALKQLSGLKCTLVGAFMVNAYKMAKFRASLPALSALLLAYDDTFYTQCYAAQALFGGIRVDGRLPVNLSGIASMGQGIEIDKTRLGYTSPEVENMRPELTEKIDSIILDAIAEGAFPGAQIIVAHRGNVVVDGSYGNITYGGPKVTPFTVYDCASVSKTVGTLPGVMKAYDMGLFALDEPASKYIPGLRVEGKDSITPRMLLYHQTGIPAALNMYEVMFDTTTYSGKLYKSKRDKTYRVPFQHSLYGHKDAKLRTDIVSRKPSEKTPWEAAKGLWVGKEAYDTIMGRIYSSQINPARPYVYSCLNFSLLMDLEQRTTGQPHEIFVTDSVWAPLGAYSMCYRPTLHHPLDNIAYTEDDPFLRRQHVHGYVHDETAAFSGGVQGNAGVFSTANDIAKLCQMWLNDGIYGDKRILSEETSTLFTTDKSPDSRRGLGFDKPDTENPDYSPTIEEADPSVYGHTGFTGTIFWVDPANDLIFVFLCNRVDPSRYNPAFGKTSARSKTFREVYRSLQ